MRKLRITVGEKVFDVEVEVVDYELSPSSTPITMPPPSAPAAPAQPAAPQPPMPPQQTQSGGGVYSPMSGKVLKTHVKEGDSVKSGDLLLVLEAMKMENMILASTSGVVKNMSVRDGDTVDEGQCLMTLG